MSYDSAATRARLLAAAYDEFVRVGLAGARVERIAKEAKANKQAIYAYFGSKEALFDAVLGDRLSVLADVAPFRADNLAAYTGALFDELVADPGLQRLTQWKMLERPEATDQERDAHLDKAKSLALHTKLPVPAAMDVMMVALAAAQSWNTTAEAIRNPYGEDPARRLAEHRKSVVAAVAAMVAAATA
ncbi:TetR/AcrR family transcriptional regulator [Lentzea sp. NPDC054927]